MSNFRIESLTEWFQYFKNYWFKWVKWTFTENLVDISFLFFSDNEQKISISHRFSAKSHLTVKSNKWLDRFWTPKLGKPNLDQGLLLKNNDMIHQKKIE